MHGHRNFGPFGRGGFGPGGPFGHGNRARRGDVQSAVIALLKEQPMHGYQIIQELSTRTNGAWNPSPGSVYPTLQLLEDQGYVESTQDGGRRVYSLTESGRAFAETLPEGPPWEDMSADSADPSRRLREATFGLMGAAAQIGRAGTPEQVEKTAGIMTEARKSIYKLLAGDDE